MDPDSRDVVERSVADREATRVSGRDWFANGCVPQLVLRDVDSDDVAAGGPKDLCVQARSAPEVEAQPITPAKKADQRIPTQLSGWSGNTFVPIG